MNLSTRRTISVATVIAFVVFGLVMFLSGKNSARTVSAQTEPTPEPTPVFDQAAAIAKLRESIKGREQEPAGKVFKNVRDFAEAPAGRLLAVMEFGYARSLGVDCTHCHTPENWASDEKRAKKIAREMRAMAARINEELLGSVKAFEGREGRDRPVINCTTCHRGQIIPALNLK